jgi:hypothetical protein
MSRECAIKDVSLSDMLSSSLHHLSLLLSLARRSLYFTRSLNLTSFISTMSESSGEHDHHSGPHSLIIPDASGVIPTSAEARSKRRIAALEEELEMAKFERGTKQRFVSLLTICLLLIDLQRKTTYFVSQGRVIRRMVALYISLEDLIAENDRRCEERWENSTPE